MRRLIKRLILLAIIGAGGAALFKALRSRPAATAPAPSSEWPPFEPRAEPRIDTRVEPRAEPRADVAKAGAIGFLATEAEHAVDVQAAAAAAATASASSDWVEPVDGACPDGYPIKANDSSHIFHTPGGRFYDRTVPERCYASADAAERDGYRRAKA